MLKAVIFDIDGTLYDYEAAHAHAFAALTDYACDAFALTPKRFEALHHEADLLLRQRAGTNCAAIHNRLLRYQLILELIGRPVGCAPTLEKLYWDTLILWMKPNPGLHEAFDFIKSRGLLLGICTNMTADWQYVKLEKLGVLHQVDFMVTSEEASAEKPDRRLFDLCAEKAKCPPCECAFVGDSMKGDALGAKAAGMRPIWLHDGADTPVDFPTIPSLEALPDLIAKEC